jgi:DNA-binding NtrC family response regulator
MHYHWPGNIREFENFVKRYLVYGEVEPALLEQMTNQRPEPIVVPKPSMAHFTQDAESYDLKQVVRDLKAQAECAAIRVALGRSKGNRAEAARLLNISAKALMQKVRRYGAVM